MRILNNLVITTSGGALFDNIGVHVCLADAETRARKALRQAQQRARGAA